MIDDIVEMILKEARARDRKNINNSAWEVINEIGEKLNNAIVKYIIDQQRKEQDEKDNP